MKKLVIAIVILAGLLVVADFGAAAAAEYQVSNRLRHVLGLADDPEVRVNGFPFLTQAAAGDFRDVQVSANGVPVGELRDVGVEATLRHVRLSLSDVIGGSLQEVRIDEVEGRVRLRASDLGRVIGIPDLRIEPAPPEEVEEAGGGAEEAGDEASSAGDATTAAVQLTGTIDLAGEQVEVSVIGTISLTGGTQVRISPSRLAVDAGGTGPVELAPQLQQSLLGSFSTTVEAGNLPLDVTPTAVRVESGALLVAGSATDVVIRNG
ncbi:LmeA family phospholipid-binding protein [Actinoalloteichus spitiensis]|uniref:LmeA family phospholipid-binding protein n=1 Tax=Actinoalloteichus spitiensis TaxID=252394 RepID=UPI00037A6819|nr:DUF2993 domain-containing protein [Actinoalloteichus spitiensis]